MESRVNYALVGFFVLIFGIAGVFIVIWLIGTGNVNKNYKRYIILTTSNVSGLHIDSPVRYKGLDVGRVYDIKIDKKNPEYIKIYIEVEKNLPINENTVARITSNGLTGISYVDLSYTKHPKEPLIKFEKEPYPVIPTVPTTLQRISEALPKALTSLKEAADRVSSLFDNATVNSVKLSVKHINKLTEELTATEEKLNKLINKIDRLVANSNSLVLYLQKDAITTNKTILTARKTINSAYFTLSRIDLLIDKLNELVQYTKDTTLQKSSLSLEELKRTLIQLKQFIIELRSDPSLLIKGRKQESLLRGKK